MIVLDEGWGITAVVITSGCGSILFYFRTQESGTFDSREINKIKVHPASRTPQPDRSSSHLCRN
jgi:hypothetical protein